MFSTTSRLPVPAEIIHEILHYLTNIHDCPSCLQADLTSFSLSSRRLHAIATPHLYSSIALASTHTHRAAASYPRRLHALCRTLASSPHLSGLVKHLVFSPTETETTKQWSAIVSHTPNLRTLQGVETLFPAAANLDCDSDSEPNSAAVQALTSLTQLRQVVLHTENITCRLPQLFNSWPCLDTLVLGNIIADSSSFLHFTFLPRSLKHAIFHDLDLDSETHSERENALLSLPPLQSLAIEYTHAFKLSHIARYLQQGDPHAKNLQDLRFQRQLRKANPPTELAALLAAAKGLKRLELSLTRYPSDAFLQEDVSELLASASLEEMAWRPVYTTAETVTHEDSFMTLLLASLGSLPRLRTLRVSHEIRSTRDTEEPQMYRELRDECEREGSIVTLDPKMVGCQGKRVLVVIDEPSVGCAEMVAEMKRGVGAGGVCAVEMEEVVVEEKGC